MAIPCVCHPETSQEACLWFQWLLDSGILLIPQYSFQWEVLSVSPSSWVDEACDYFEQWIKYGGNYIMPITGLCFQKECPSALLFEAIGIKWKRSFYPAGPLHKKRGPFQHQVCVWRLPGTLQCSLDIRWLSLSDLRMAYILKGYLHLTFGNCLCKKIENPPIINCNIQSYIKQYFKYSDVLATWLKSIDGWDTHIILNDWLYP